MLPLLVLLLGSLATSQSTYLDKKNKIDSFDAFSNLVLKHPNNNNNNNNNNARNPNSLPKNVNTPPRHSNRFHGADRSGSVKSDKAINKRPNIVFFLTDDQDVELGSLDFMPKTSRYLRAEGATFPNAFSTTPMCCPSRSSMLTGMYVHNHNTYSNNENCSGPAWRSKYESNTFGKLLQDSGYHTGFFGKYLNEYSGTHVPVGWSEWMGLVKNTRFYNYSLNHNGTIVKHRDDYSKDYLTDVIARNSIEFLRRSKKFHPNDPVAMVLSMPAPHGPEDSAPQYQHLFMGIKSHRTPSWNSAPNPDKQWLLQYTNKMNPLQVEFTDLLQTKRLQTLQSVDDAVEKVYQTLAEMGELDNTYIFYSSDHGYHLGQFGLVKGKAMPYEFDIKVPFLVRGPGVPKNVTIPSIVLNLDLAPTFLDIAGHPPPPTMDGSSILKVIDGARNSHGSSKKKPAVWRDTFLVERGKLTAKKLRLVDRIEAQINNLTTSKTNKLDMECSKPEYQSPCRPSQKWKCLRNEVNELRFFKCRGHDAPFIGPASSRPRCRCFISPKEKELQLSFLKSNVNQPEKIQPNFIQSNSKVKRRSPSHNGLMNIHNLDHIQSQNSIQNHLNLSNEWNLIEVDPQRMPVPCRIRAQGSVECQPLVYTDHALWEEQKNSLEKAIEDFNGTLLKLQKVRNHLLEREPTPSAAPPPTTQERTPARPNNNNNKNNNSVLVGSDVIRSNDVTDCICDGDPRDADEEDNADDLDVDNDTAIAKKKSPWFVRKQRRLENSTKKKKKKRRRRIPKKHYTLHDLDSRELAIVRRTSQRRFIRGCADPIGCSQLDHAYNFTWDLTNQARHDPACHIQGLECFRMDNEHWKVKPFWERGPFCSCSNSNNNTYWCLRTINDTHNFLYCEFITGFISFYDMNNDPHQLRNIALDMNYNVLHQLHKKLGIMKNCRGAECSFPPEKLHLKEKRMFNQEFAQDKYPKPHIRKYLAQVVSEKYW